MTFNQIQKAFNDYWGKATKHNEITVSERCLAYEDFSVGCHTGWKAGRLETISEVLEILNKEPRLGDTGFRCIELASFGAKLEALRYSSASQIDVEPKGNNRRADAPLPDVGE